MSASLQHVASAFSITLPLILLASLGMLCRSTGLINQTFVDAASGLIFKLSLPCLLFMLVLSADWQDSSGYTLIAFSIANTLLITVLAIGASKLLVAEPRDRGVFVQGVFRSNMGIVSLALVGSAYGTAGLALAAVPITLNTLLYNVIAVLILIPDQQNGRNTRRAALRRVMLNPLILAIACGLLAVWSGIQLPGFLDHTIRLLSQIALPLALLCVGASLQLKHLTRPDPIATWASFGKLMLAPAIAVNVAHWGFGFNGMALGILFFMTAAPAATAGFAMVVAVGGNRQLSAQMIALTTVASGLTLSLGTFLLKHWNLI
ncbi:MAG: AEC family transporter [Granulosicoccaceae bacterium]